MKLTMMKNKSRKLHSLSTPPASLWKTLGTVEMTVAIIVVGVAVGAFVMV
jgi:hypothetical protein